MRILLPWDFEPVKLRSGMNPRNTRCVVGEPDSPLGSLCAGEQIHEKIFQAGWRGSRRISKQCSDRLLYCCGPNVRRPHMNRQRRKATCPHSSRFLRTCARILVVIVASLFTIKSAHAASVTWIGTSNFLWSDPANWSSLTVPGSGDTATFNNAGHGNTSIGLFGPTIISSIVFDTANAASYDIGSGETITLNAGGAVTMNATVTVPQNIGASLKLGTASGAEAFTFTNNSPVTDAILFFSGTISSGANSGTKTVTVTGAGSTEMYGSINDGAGMVVLNKTNSGTLSLNGVNTFTGSTTVSGGTLALTSAQSLRSTSKVQLNSGGKLELLGNRDSDRIADTARLTLAGGELYARSAYETMQGIDLSVDSAIHLQINDGVQGVLSFFGMTRTGGILTIYDWIGSASSSGLDDRVFISGALAPDILANIHFEGYAPGATQLGTGEVVPGVVPEPGSLGLLLVGTLGVLNRRRRAGC